MKKTKKKAPAESALASDIEKVEDALASTGAGEEAAPGPVVAAEAPPDFLSASRRTARRLSEGFTEAEETEARIEAARVGMEALRVADEEAQRAVAARLRNQKVEILSRELTEERRRTLAQELVEIHVLVDAVKAERDAAIAGFKKRTADATARASEIVDACMRGAEFVPVLVGEDWEPKRGIADVVRCDTGEVFRTRPLTTSEMQLALGLDGGAS